MSYKILIPQDIAPEGKAYLTERGYLIKMGRGTTEADLIRDVADCAAILIRTAKIPASVLAAGEKLKVISRHGVGVDNIDVATATERGIWVTFAPESNAQTVAEYVIGTIVALARNFIRCDRATRSGDWEFRDRLPGYDLAEKTLGIVGFGKIGRLVAKKAALGLDMKVLAYDPYVKSEQFGQFVTAASWEEILAASDFLTLHVPGTPSTRHLVGKREFSLMKKTACLINAARGDVVNEEDLVAALRAGTIAAAALDVYAQEPPAPDHPLFALDNVMLTPHNAALTRECMVRMALHAAQGIDDVLAGRRPAWPVNNPIERK